MASSAMLMYLSSSVGVTSRKSANGKSISRHNNIVIAFFERKRLENFNIVL